MFLWQVHVCISSCCNYVLCLALLFYSSIFPPQHYNTIIMHYFHLDYFSSLPFMSCGVYAEGGTDHSGLFSVLTHARHWHIGAAGPEELGQICHTSQPQPSLMHIPSKCTRAIVNRVSLYHRGTMRVEILARSFLTNPKGFSDRVQMCVLFV